jgi:hypothetical protein
METSINNRHIHKNEILKMFHVYWLDDVCVCVCIYTHTHTHTYSEMEAVQKAHMQG